MNTKKLIYSWITVDHLRRSTHKERDLYKICNCGIQRRTQNTKKIVDGGRLSTQRTQMNLIAVDREWSSMVNTKHKMKAERTRVWINAKVEFLWERELNTKCCTQKKWLRIRVQINTIELNGHGKNEALAKNFNARKADLSRSTTVFTQINSIQRYTNALLNDWLIDLLSGFLKLVKWNLAKINTTIYRKPKHSINRS